MKQLNKVILVGNDRKLVPEGYTFEYGPEKKYYEQTIPRSYKKTPSNLNPTYMIWHIKVKHELDSDTDNSIPRAILYQKPVDLPDPDLNKWKVFIARKKARLNTPDININKSVPSGTEILETGPVNLSSNVYNRVSLWDYDTQDSDE